MALETKITITEGDMIVEGCIGDKGEAPVLIIKQSNDWVMFKAEDVDKLIETPQQVKQHLTNS